MEVNFHDAVQKRWIFSAFTKVGLELLSFKKRGRGDGSIGRVLDSRCHDSSSNPVRNARKTCEFFSLIYCKLKVVEFETHLHTDTHRFGSSKFADVAYGFAKNWSPLHQFVAALLLYQ